MKQRILNLALMASLFASTQSFGQENKTDPSEAKQITPVVETSAEAGKPVEPEAVADKKGASFVDKTRTDTFLNSLTTTTRDTGKSKSFTKNGLKMVLDIRLPIIFESCDLAINHEMLRLAYAYVAEFPGAENQLKATADAIVRKKGNDIQGVSPNCRAALKGFSIAVLRVYLGGEWDEKDEEKLQNARKEPSKNNE